MQGLSVHVDIDAPAADVWAVLADFGNISAFNPNLTNSYVTTEHPNGPGAARHCDLTVPGASIEERVVAWDEGRSYVVEIFDGTRNPIERALATLAVEPVGPDRSRASMKFEWRAKGGPFADLLDRAMRPQNRKAVVGTLAGLKHHVETGGPVAGGQRIDRDVVRTA